MSSEPCNIEFVTDNERTKRVLGNTDLLEGDEALEDPKKRKTDTAENSGPLIVNSKRRVGFLDLAAGTFYNQEFEYAC